MLIEVFGPGCASCELAGERVRQAVKETGSDATVQEIHDLNVIMGNRLPLQPGHVDGSAPGS